MSNTEQMVSVQLIESILSNAAQGYFSKDHGDQLRALLSQPAAQHQAAPLGWVCGEGQEFTACSDHAQDLRAEGIDLTPAYSRGQHQGEPVMKLEAEKLWGGAGEYAVSFVKAGWLQECRDTGGTFLLYTHPDVGEAERLRYKADLYDEVWELATGLGYMNVTTAISKLRAQLAERDALLRKILEKLQEEYWDRYAGLDETRELIEATLSASAEPGAPVCEACQGQGEVYSGRMADQGYNQPPEPIMDECPECKWSEAADLNLPLRCDEKNRTRRAFDYAQGWNQALDLVVKMNSRAALERKP